MVAVGDCLTSIFGGVVIFAIIGYMAHELGVDIKDVATQGIHLKYYKVSEFLNEYVFYLSEVKHYIVTK